MIDSKEDYKFDLGVKGLRKGYIKFLELKLQNGVAVRMIWSENLGLKGLRKNISHYFFNSQDLFVNSPL